MANEVTEATVRRNSWKSIYNIINDNKVSGTTVYAGYPNKNPSFPAYALHPVSVSSSSASLGDIQDYDFSVEIELFCIAAKDRKEKIDEMKDNLQSTMLNNLTTLNSQNLGLAEDWFEDNESDSLDINNEKFHYGLVTLYFRFN